LSHERIWAPWRLAYIVGQTAESPPPEPLVLEPGADPGCFFCRDVADPRDQQNLVLGRGPRTITVLNRYPYNNGHLMVAPRAHLARLDQLDAATHAECLDTITRLVNLLERLMRVQGFNIGLNLGNVAGAGVPGHLHWHIVPRWQGDVNFMGVTAEVRVISQSLEALWELLQPEFGRAMSQDKP
jgi:ATP adenylyltransferase